MHFYAATSMEMCARPLFSTSPHRDQLLQKARTHYERAAVLIQKAEESVTAKSRPSSVISTLSSIHSPTESVSSRAWTSETGISSPTHSVYSVDEMVTKPAHGEALLSPTKKKVSFSASPDAQKPYIFVRPDSPTLGFEDEYFTSALSRAGLPEAPKRLQSISHYDNGVAGTDDDDEDDATPRAATQPSNPFEDERDHLEDSIRLAGSLHRYCETLAGLKSLVAVHSSSLDSLLEEEGQTSAAAAAAVRERTMATPVSDEMRSLDRQARIERLRQSGWQRKRFDPRRYEELRNNVLAELA